VERAIVHGVGVGTAHAGITVSLPDRPGAAAGLFRAVAAAGAPVGAIAQHLPAPAVATVVFTVPRTSCDAVVAALTAAGYAPAAELLAEVALAGVAMRTDPLVPAIFGESLAMAGVPLTLVSLENHRLSVHCPEPLAPAAVRALCEAFEVPANRAGLGHRAP
jgi:aspartate kinase